MLDTRNADEEVILEIRPGRGVVGGLDELLDGTETALPGYEVAADGQTHPINMVDAAGDDDGILLPPAWRR